MDRTSMEPIFRFWEKQSGTSQTTTRIHQNDAAILAIALADPEQAADWAVQSEKSLDERTRRSIPQPWEIICKTLTLNRHELGQLITKRIYNYWVIGEYDFSAA